MRIPQLLIALSPWSSYSTPGTSHLSSDSPELSPLTVTPIPCLSAPLPPTIEDLVTCFEGYTVPKDHYTSTTYNNAQPTTPQLAAWNLAVHNLLDVDNNCASVAVPTAINTFYRRSLFTEAGGRAFCILSEIDATGGHYTKGWGFMAVPVNRRAVSRFIHISAPHPIYDDGTPRQAAAIFQKTGAKSLLISGRHRNAYTASSCIGADYSRTDPAHNTDEPFFAASTTARTWQITQGGCASERCAYIQFHGKGCSTCSCDTTFISAGLNGDALNWYTTFNSPARRIRDRLDIELPTWRNSLPTRSECELTATRNVVGRLLNGVDMALVCTTAATAITVTGEFVHIEQSQVAREPDHYGPIAKAVNVAMLTTCDTGMVPHWFTLLCVDSTLD